MEVIEHVDPPRLPALERVVFGAARPGAVIVTTPNIEYNVRYEGLHRACATPTTASSGPAPSSPRGPPGRGDVRLPRRAAAASATTTPSVGPPTQMGVFTP